MEFNRIIKKKLILINEIHFFGTGYIKRLSTQRGEKGETDRSGSVHPDDDALLVCGHFFVDVNTLLDVNDHRHSRHECEDCVEDDSKNV